MVFSPSLPPNHSKTTRILPESCAAACRLAWLKTRGTGPKPPSRPNPSPPAPTPIMSRRVTPEPLCRCLVGMLTHSVFLVAIAPAGEAPIVAPVHSSVNQSDRGSTEARECAPGQKRKDRSIRQMYDPRQFQVTQTAQGKELAMRSRTVVWSLVGSLLVVLSALVQAQAPAPAAPPPTKTLRPVRNFVTVTDQIIREPKREDWLIYRGNYQGWGYSPLDRINKTNVENLQLVWSRAMEPGTNQATPLVYNGVMYLGNPGDVIQAIDVATGDLMWEYRHPLPELTSMRNPLGQRKRAIALYGDYVYTVTWDNHVLALDARTGEKAWETDRGGDLYVSNSSGPIVANGGVVAGSTCQYAGYGCYVTGHDAKTGKELWRNTMIPRPGGPGDETWAGPPDETRWMAGVWGHLTYDPDLDLMYYGSSGVGPASEAQRKMPGATMAGTDTRFAVRPKTGEVVWKHQVLPRDNWDQECTFEMMPITTPVNPDPSVM